MRDMENYFVTFYGGKDDPLGAVYLVHTHEDGLKALRRFADDETLPPDWYWDDNSVYYTPHGTYFFGQLEQLPD